MCTTARKIHGSTVLIVHFAQTSFRYGVNEMKREFHPIKQYLHNLKRLTTYTE